jgi:hypothetical protein
VTGRPGPRRQPPEPRRDPIAPDTPLPPSPFRYDTKPEPERCAGPDCTETLTVTGTGRPARYCSPACRLRAHRARRRDQQRPTTIEIDLGSASSRGRPADQAWMVRIRRGDRSVIVAIGLRRHAAISLAEQIADVLDAPTPTH